MNNYQIVENHINILINEYKLNYIYNKYIILSILSSLLNEMFYWLLLLFNGILQKSPDLINNFIIILFIILFLFIPVDNLFGKTRAELLEKIKIANYTYYLSKLSKIDKFELLKFDIVKYTTTLENVNINIEEYIINLKIKYEIKLKIVTLIIVAFNKKYILIVFIFIIYYYIVKYLNEDKLRNEEPITNDFFKYSNIVKNYLINSKSLFINNEFNASYFNDNLNKLENINKLKNNININLESKIDYLTFVFITIVICNKLKDINIYEFLTYFFLIYDIGHVSDRITLFYKNKINLPKMKERIIYLNNYININNKFNTNIKNIDKYSIIINKISNEAPKLICNKKIYINNNDHFLIDGKSGSGKTSFLYLFKGILIPNELNIYPNIDSIINISYLILPNNKDLYNGYLYDIISNYNKYPNIDLINEAMLISNFDITKVNKMINIEILSGGEKIKLVLTRAIYSIITNNYKILLFDEIDENLNEDLAYTICQNIKKYFKNKIILYITHNNKVKSLFNKKINIDKGEII
jgi:ABC-type lipoprotein export system ATPase subunit